MDFQSRNLTIPRGKIFFAKFLAGTQMPGPYRELGNCPEFTLTRESDKLEHWSSQRGMKVKDASIVIEASLNGTVTTDDIKTENIEYWFMGETSTQVTTAQTGLTDTYEVNAAGDHFQLGRTDDNPGGYRKVSNLVVTDGATSPTTFDLGDDYAVDEDLGILYIPEGSAAIGGAIEVEYDVASSSREITIAGEEQIEGELKFVSYNATGSQSDIIIPRAQIGPNGDFSIVNDPESTAFQTMPLSISALQKNSMALAYREGRPVA